MARLGGALYNLLIDDSLHHLLGADLGIGLMEVGRIVGTSIAELQVASIQDFRLNLWSKQTKGALAVVFGKRWVRAI